MKEKKLFYFGKLILAFFFLFNPNANLIDVLPDSVGYLLLLLATYNATDRFPHFDEAYKGFSKLFWISFAKLPALYIMLQVVSINNYERSMVTVFSLSFAVLELLFAFPAFRDFFAAFSHLGEKNGLMPLLAAGKCKNGIKGLEKFTYVFLISKALLSFLPELSLLSVFDPLGTAESSMVNFARFYPICLIFAILVGIVLGAFWLYYTVSYFSEVRKSEVVNEFLTEKEKELSAVLIESDRKLIRKSALYLIITALVFAFDVILDDKNYLPDGVSGIFFLLAFVLLFKESKYARFGIVSSSLYSVFAILSQVSDRNFFHSFSYTDVIHKSEAAASYAWVALWSVLEAITLIALIWLLQLVLKDFGTVLLGGSVKQKNAALETGIQKELSRKLKLFSFFGIVSAVWHVAETFLLTLTERHVVTAEEANEYFAEGHVLYYPVFGGSWFLGFLLTALWFVFGLYYVLSLKEEAQSLEED